MSWEEIAQVVHKPATTIRHWPNRQHDIWMPAFTEARESLFAEAEQEARDFQLGLLRDDEAPLSLRQSAAHSLLNAAARVWPQKSESNVKLETVGPPEAGTVPETELRSRVVRTGNLREV